MRKSIVRSFLVAQALVGVVLTCLWVAGRWESRFMATPLFWIGAILVLFAFIPDSWIPFKNTAKEALIQEASSAALPSTPHIEQQRFAAWNRLSVELVLIAACVLLSGLLIRFVAPIPAA